MKKYFLFLVLSVFLCGNISAQTMITGKLLGFDGKSISLSHINLYKPNSKQSICAGIVEKDGSYKVTTNVKGPYVIKFNGVKHTGESLTLLTQDYLVEQINVQLGLTQLPLVKSTPKLLSDLNNFDPKKAQDMVKQPDGTYSISIPFDGEKFRYKFLIGMLSQSIGTDLDAEFEFDPKYSYLSVSKPKNGKVEISCDTTKLNYSESKPLISFGNPASTIARAANLFSEALSVQRKWLNGFITSTINGTKFVYSVNELCQTKLNQFDSEKDPLLKPIYLLVAAEMASLNNPKDSKLSDNVAGLIIKSIEPTSFLLELNPSSWVNLVYGARETEINNQLARRDYVDKFLEKSMVDRETKASIIISILGGAKSTYNEPARKKYYDIMTKKFSDTEAAKKLKDFSEEFKLGKGSPVPKFSFVSHDDPKVTFTNESFKGKIYLIDFWATWCGPCKAEMPELHKVYEKFKDKGFEILSISFDQKEEAIDKYRKGDWKMPWHHAFVDGEIKAKVAKDFDAASIPKPFLVDGTTGKILALTTDLRGEELEKTLAKFIK